MPEANESLTSNTSSMIDLGDICEVTLGPRYVRMDGNSAGQIGIIESDDEIIKSV